MKIRWNPTAKAWEVTVDREETSKLPRGVMTWDNGRKVWWAPELAWRLLERAAGKEHGPLFTRYHLKGEPMEITVATTHRPLLPHQTTAVSHLVECKRAGLFDDMGAGKTASVLAAYETIRQRQPDVRLLVMCPKRVMGEWANEVRLTLGRDIDIEREWVINYDKVWRAEHNLGLNAYAARGPVILVLDECHVAAGIDSKRFVAIDELARKVPYLWALSGTPVRNKPDSFFPVYRLISGAAVTFPQFMALYCNTFRQRITGYKRLEDLEAVTRQYCLRREVHEILTLPPLTEQTVPVKIEGRQRAIYNQLATGLRTNVGHMDSVEYEQKINDVRVQINSLLMAAAHPALIDPEATDEGCAKLAALDELLEEAGDQKVLIWSRYPRVLERIAARCREHGRHAVTLHGANSDKDNYDNKHAFLTDPDIKVCCLSIGAFAEGINLQVATIAIYHDLYWMFDKFHQSQRRLWRTGQTKPVHVYYLIGAPIEEYVLDSLAKKEQYQQVITGRARDFDVSQSALLRLLKKLA